MNVNGEAESRKSWLQTFVLNLHNKSMLQVPAPFLSLKEYGYLNDHAAWTVIEFMVCNKTYSSTGITRLRLISKNASSLFCSSVPRISASGLLSAIDNENKYKKSPFDTKLQVN